ncbi:MAG TPA: hypothetical protein PKC23_01055 [Candidatus Desulfobacillus sp.]|nr:hypothetical protein [Candidatus Desulfobacillus sp.]
MKRARRRRLKPRNPLALDPLLGKGGVHQAKGKKAARARQKARFLRDQRDLE